MTLLKWMAPAVALAAIALVAPLPGVQAAPEAGDDALEFSIEETIANVPDGTEFSLDAFAGKVVMVEFFATW
jgi:cytochrome oxidase Cu insertion factor (SCO1/SenC/PrrC family)